MNRPGMLLARGGLGQSALAGGTAEGPHACPSSGPGKLQAAKKQPQDSPPVL